MRKSEIAQIMGFIAKAYERFSYDDDKVDAWYALFANYDGAMLHKAAEICAKKSRYAPVPADLEKAYWELMDERNANIAEGLRREAQERAKKGEVCPWCGGTGFIKVQEVMDGRMFEPVAPCSCSGDAKWLKRFQADERYVWSDKKRMFVYRTNWIGEEKQQALPVLDFGNVGKSF